jgi:CRISPR-associated endonuclease/helicase Cas3
MSASRFDANGSDSVAAAHAPLTAGLPWHELELHLQQVGALAADRIRRAIDPTWGRLAGIWHDLGKYAPDWQDFIRSAGQGASEAHLEEENDDAEQQPRGVRGPDHSTAGAIHAWKTLGEEFGGPLAFVISGHHGGIPNKENLRERLRKEEKLLRHADSIGAAHAAIVTPHHPRPSWPEWFSGMPRPEGTRSLELFIRVLFSGLVDADFLDTEAYFATAGGDRARHQVEARQKAWPPFDAYRLVLDRHLEDKAGIEPDRTVNRLRAAVVHACRDAAYSASGIFTLTVPTGGGKTLASLAFALDHAHRHGHRRVIVALPFTSIIEQTGAVFRETFEPLGSDVVLEHHSALDPQRATPLGRVSSENWEAPLIVTTQVQLFESLFANRPSACRKLHSLIGSVLVLDEVQTLPGSLLEPILSVIDELASHYGVTVVMTTATQPAFHRRDLGGTVFRGLNVEPREIIPQELARTLWDSLRRVTVHWPSESPAARPAEPSAFWTDLGNQLAAHDQVLAITHLKKDAQELWQAVALHDPGALHLSAAMCPAHRSRVLIEVKRRLEATTACRLVSTQVVEAGVDIDFPVVYRAMAGLESLAQSAGRCNREGRSDRGEFFVFEAPTRPPRTLRLHQDVARQMRDNEPNLDLSSPDTFRKYFDRLYAHIDIDRPRIQESRAALRFEETASLFRMIDEATVPVFVPFDDDATRLLARLRFGGPSREVLRGLQRYAVSVYSNQFNSLRAEGAVEETGKDSGFWTLCSDLHYHEALGLRTTADPSVALII